MTFSNVKRIKTEYEYFACDDFDGKTNVKTLTLFYYEYYTMNAKNKYKYVTSLKKIHDLRKSF